jgi:hypothetical protein
VSAAVRRGRGRVAGAVAALLTTSLLACLSPAAPGNAAPTWVTPAMDLSSADADASEVEVGTDSAGNAVATTTRTAASTVTDPPTPTPTVPTITKLRLSNHRIHALGRPRAHRQTRLVVGLSTAATVNVVVRSRHRRPTARGGRPRRMTVRLTRPMPAGTSRLPIHGRLAHVRLRPDRYSITVVATNAVGPSPPRRVTLVVVRA